MPPGEDSRVGHTQGGRDHLGPQNGNDLNLQAITEDTVLQDVESPSGDDVHPFGASDRESSIPLYKSPRKPDTSRNGHEGAHTPIGSGAEPTGSGAEAGAHGRTKDDAEGADATKQHPGDSVEAPPGILKGSTSSDLIAESRPTMNNKSWVNSFLQRSVIGFGLAGSPRHGAPQSPSGAAQQPASLRERAPTLARLYDSTFGTSRINRKNKKEMKALVRRHHVEKTAVFMIHMCACSALLSIFFSVVMGDEICPQGEAIKWVVMFFSLVQLVYTIRIFLIRRRVDLMESPLRLKAISRYYFIGEVLMCFLMAYPRVRADFHCPLGGTVEVYSMDQYMTVLISIRFIMSVRSFREHMRIRDNGMLFVARIMKVNTGSFGFNVKYAMSTNPGKYLLGFFIFFMVWLTYMVRISELPKKCYLEDYTEYDCHYLTDSPFQSHMYIRNTFWMVIVTVATVGFGDLTPNTIFGRIFIACVMFMGTIFTSLLLGVVVEKISPTRNESHIVRLVEHKSWKTSLEWWASVWIQRWWRYRSKNRRRSKRRSVIFVRSESQMVSYLERVSSNTKLAAQAAVRQLDPNVMFAHDKFLALAHDQKSRPSQETSVNELRRAVESLEEDSRGKFKQVDQRLQGMEAVLMSLHRKLAGTPPPLVQPTASGDSLKEGS